jgi:hypothetical protein
MQKFDRNEQQREIPLGRDAQLASVPVECVDSDPPNCMKSPNIAWQRGTHGPHAEDQLVIPILADPNVRFLEKYSHSERGFDLTGQFA